MKKIVTWITRLSNRSGKQSSPKFLKTRLRPVLLLYDKFQRIEVPTRDSFSSRILKVCNLSRVEARYSCVHLKIGQSRSTNCKSRIIKLRFKYYSSRVIPPESARYSYPSYSRIQSFFGVVKRGRVICRNLLYESDPNAQPKPYSFKLELPVS